MSGDIQLPSPNPLRLVSPGRTGVQITQIAPASAVLGEQMLYARAVDNVKWRGVDSEGSSGSGAPNQPGVFDGWNATLKRYVWRIEGISGTTLVSVQHNNAPVGFDKWATGFGGNRSVFRTWDIIQFERTGGATPGAAYGFFGVTPNSPTNDILLSRPMRLAIGFEVGLITEISVPNNEAIWRFKVYGEDRTSLRSVDTAVLSGTPHELMVEVDPVDHRARGYIDLVKVADVSLEGLGANFGITLVNPNTGSLYACRSSQTGVTARMLTRMGLPGHAWSAFVK